jgi:hypothetical protein
MGAGGMQLLNTGIERGGSNPILRNYVNDFLDDLARILRRCLGRATEPLIRSLSRCYLAGK